MVVSPFMIVVVQKRLKTPFIRTGHIYSHGTYHSYLNTSKWYGWERRALKQEMLIKERSTILYIIKISGSISQTWKRQHACIVCWVYSVISVRHKINPLRCKIYVSTQCTHKITWKISWLWLSTTTHPYTHAHFHAEFMAHMYTHSARTYTSTCSHRQELSSNVQN